MDPNHGPCSQFAINDFYRGLGGFPTCKTRDNKQARCNFNFPGRGWEYSIPHGLLCL